MSDVDNLKQRLEAHYKEAQAHLEQAALGLAQAQADYRSALETCRRAFLMKESVAILVDSPKVEQ